MATAEPQTLNRGTLNPKPLMSWPGGQIDQGMEGLSGRSGLGSGFECGVGRTFLEFGFKGLGPLNPEPQTP